MTGDMVCMIQDMDIRCDIDQMTGDEAGCQITTMTRRFGSGKRERETSHIPIWPYMKDVLFGM